MELGKGSLRTAGSLGSCLKAATMEDTCVAIAAGRFTSFVTDDEGRLWAFGEVSGGVLGFSCRGFSKTEEDKLVLLPRSCLHAFRTQIAIDDLASRE